MGSNLGPLALRKIREFIGLPTTRVPANQEGRLQHNRQQVEVQNSSWERTTSKDYLVPGNGEISLLFELQKESPPPENIT